MVSEICPQNYPQVVLVDQSDVIYYDSDQNTYLDTNKNGIQFFCETLKNEDN